ncbi:hypothetical protein COU18_02550 [Candidatus Kaiserbacteria bacterium CG10_big_fil_rev_8_21_14_0_10_51_14]|uniref:Uncharacterized protein n=1 Tax=Candidatus Kaiserbacteria bacterium CG10_big_fil_rev_8_21_14_0_10_51_14 TaxID=1974610 RepID=A0A2H0UAW9_9BACT|nr:MAG: hypothetical protein COU18_02550 [Candidatus Kaiserbacteria bacterium CG10_big_fil_rev_8_21_14_0_10_51_14]
MTERAAEKAGTYELRGIESDVFVRYKPEYISRGGDHLVYRIPDHPNVVVKASWKKAVDIFREAQSRALGDDAARSYAEERFSTDVRQKNTDVRNLRRYFGEEHTLPERRYLMQVPISQSILEQLLRDYYQGKEPPPVLVKNIEGVQNLWTSVSVQKKCNELLDPARLSFCFGRFLEDTSPDEDYYTAITHALLYGSNHTISTREFLLFQDKSPSKGLTHLIERAQSDPGLKSQLIDFVKKAITYADNEGRILDLIGKDNVIFTTRDRVWNYLLVDSLPLAVRPILGDFREYVKQPEGRVIDRRRRLHLLQVINFARAINGTAAAVDIRERLPTPEIPQSLLHELLHWNSAGKE